MKNKFSNLWFLCFNILKTISLLQKPMTIFIIWFLQLNSRQVDTEAYIFIENEQHYLADFSGARIMARVA